MKSNFIIIFCILLLTAKPMSQKHDVNWLLGYGNSKNPVIFGRTLINFSKDTINLSANYGGYKFRMGFEANSYSDANGKLRVFYDGFRLGNAVDFNIVENGDTLNPGQIWDLYNGGAYPISDGSIFIPSAVDTSIVYLIHASLDYYQNTTNVYSPKIYFSKIEINENGGRGKVIQKNVPFLSGNFTPMVVAACRHSNGKDWWLINKSNIGPTYYFTLLDVNGPNFYKEQTIGTSVLDYSIVGNSVFSPDGKKFVRISNLDGIQLFNFDRCTGALSDFTRIDNDSIKSAYLVNVAISSNSRFLYVSTNTQIYQYDLNIFDIVSSQEIVGKWDGFIYDRYYTTSFADLQLAPDGKIYISCASGNIFLHTINKPNLKGTACDFQLRSIKLPTYIFAGLGNYPNYLLGSEENSICDSLTQTIDIYSKNEFNIYPNPSNGLLDITNLSNSNYKFLKVVFVDLFGKTKLNKTLSKCRKEWKLDLNYLNPGIYFILFYMDNQLVQSNKWILH
jgi:WD40 repeat protein